MKRQLFIHIGPHKTGTSSVQDHFWFNRHKYRSIGLLYPETGLIKSSRGWGHRHLQLAKRFQPKLWNQLISEVEASSCSKILLSSERFSIRLLQLILAKSYIERFEPRAIIVLRDECDLVRSMYFQIIKGYFSVKKARNSPPPSFKEWWSKSRQRYIYGNIVKQWSDAFGADRISYIIYPKHKNTNVVDAVLFELGLPILNRFKNSNPSIGALSAQIAISASRFGWRIGSIGMHLGLWIENMFPRIKNIDPIGFNKVEISKYYFAKNEKYFVEFPEFSKKYSEVKKVE